MDIKWSPYIPIYPNSQIPQSKKSGERVVEPSTRGETRLDVLESWEERVAKIKETYQRAAYLNYDHKGNRIIPPKYGKVLDIES